MHLSKYQKREEVAGKSRFLVILWMLFGEPLVKSAIPSSMFRVFLLRLFGAKIGLGVNIKPRVQIKYPWKLSVGNHSWIGENTWIDNLAAVTIGPNVCISQGVYLCTGSHDWSKDTFDLILKPILIDSHSWVCAKAVVGPGTQIGEGGVVGLGCVFTGVLEPWTIVSREASCLRKRSIVLGNGAHV